jgi:WD40 repeat protein/serine/threonine protein kinase
MDNLLALPIGTELAGDYRIARILGMGGFGITYLAEETPLNRGVAIKEYFPSDFAAREGTTLVRSKSRSLDEDYRWGLDRFIEEAQALATFDHANIVRVYRYFRQNNTGYMVLKLEDGVSFKSWLDKLGRRPLQAELDAILAPLLNALETIHNRSFLHRDIAPDNIMIRPDGSPVLIDFGSARREVASHLTTMSVLVKPGYSPAEQYAQDGKRQGPWTDIYALAATLYHAVTGRRPADAPGRMQRDELVAAEFAATDGVYRKGFLQAIDAALQLPVEKRPQSIADWRGMLLHSAHTIAPAKPKKAAPPPKAAAPTRKLEGADEPKPFRLKPKVKVAPDMPAAHRVEIVAAAAKLSSAPTPPSRMPGRPQLAAFIGAMTPLAAAALVNVRSGAQDALNWLQQAMPRKVADAPKPERPRGLLDRIADAQPEPTAAPPKPATEPDPETRLLRPAAVQPAPAPQLPAIVPKPKPTLPPADSLLARFKRTLRGLLLRTGLVAALVCALVTIEFWGPAVGLTIPHASGLMSGSDVSLIRSLRGHAVGVDALTITSDDLIASAGADGQILIWNGTTGAQLRSILAPGAQVTALASSEHVLLAGLADGSLGLWQMDTGEKLGAFNEHEGPIWGATFLSGSKQFATVGQDSKVRLWDSNRGARTTWTDHKRPVFAVAYSAHRRLLATAGADKTVKLWDERKRRLIRTYAGHTEDVRALAMSPDGQILASAGNDKTIVLWSTTSDGPLKSLSGHTNRIVSLDFSPDGRMLASGSEDGTVKLWDPQTGTLLTTYVGHVKAVRAVAFLPDGHRLATAGDDLTVRLWNARIGGYP